MLKKKSKLPAGTWMEKDLFKSKAYWALTGAAPQLLTYFLGKRRREQVSDNKGNQKYIWINLDSISLPYQELENLWTNPFTKKTTGITQPRITRAINDLLAKGFLAVRHPGGAYKQDKAVYALIEKWRTWSPGIVFSKRKRDVHRGYQGRKTKRDKVIELPVK